MTIYNILKSSWNIWFWFWYSSLKSTLLWVITRESVICKWIITISNISHNMLITSCSPFMQCFVMFEFFREERNKVLSVPTQRIFNNHFHDNFVTILRFTFLWHFEKQWIEVLSRLLLVISSDQNYLHLTCFMLNVCTSFSRKLC